jgi:hypothetical protein
MFENKIIGEGIFVLVLNCQAMNQYREMQVMLHAFLPSVLDRMIGFTFY